MRRIRLKNRRGATLIEAMIAMVVIAVGTAAVTELLRQVSQANRRMNFQTTAVDVFTAVATQIQDATCDVPPGAAAPGALTTDPGLWDAISNAGTWRTAAVAGSVINRLGDLSAVMPLPIQVQIRQNGAPALGNGPPAYDFEIEVRELMHDAAKDAATEGYWIRTYPVKKVCNLRLEDIGRGEFY
ncbi:MAG: prepilin-type N-terminal cleavage/methylation domain-containing protein [Myxococcota bacterium]